MYEQLRRVTTIMLTASDGNEVSEISDSRRLYRRSYCVSAHAPIEKVGGSQSQGLFPDPSRFRPAVSVSTILRELDQLRNCHI
jgi:hypothetical protein